MTTTTSPPIVIMHSTFHYNIKLLVVVKKCITSVVPNLLVFINILNKPIRKIAKPILSHFKNNSACSLVRLVGKATWKIRIVYGGNEIKFESWKVKNKNSCFDTLHCFLLHPSTSQPVPMGGCASKTAEEEEVGLNPYETLSNNPPPPLPPVPIVPMGGC